ncbi:TonB-dependent receptor [Candidatus Fermentibacteria bacterium]|nr:TonB-dependent receptor [Candidatus Fermentibacteria bacterium]
MRRVPHILLIMGLMSVCAAASPVGSIRGSVVDAVTRAPLGGANVMLAATDRGAVADSGGVFVIEAVPAGPYTLQVSFIGYGDIMKPDVIVRSGRITTVAVQLSPQAVQGQGITITAGYFAEDAEQLPSTVGFSYEEIRRAPGSGGDICRIVAGLPSLAKVDDQKNSLIVRGGSPMENAFFLDGIEVPNINHFPSQASSGGPISILNVDLIQDVRFHAGGFSAAYGDRLSSVMDIALRQGNRSQFDAQLDLNFTGFGAVVEGPLVSERGSWLVSARRSYLDLLIGAIDVGATIAPRYGDYQAKVAYDLSGAHTVSGLAVWSDDRMTSDQEQAIENDMVYFGDQDLLVGTTGVTWRALWNRNGYSTTSISHTIQRFSEDFYEAGSQAQLLKNRSTEQAWRLRNTNQFRLSDANRIEFGIEAARVVNDYDNHYAAYTSAVGDTVPASALDARHSATTFGVFVSHQIDPLPRLSVTVGTRLDRSAAANWHLSPRAGLALQLGSHTVVHAATGVFHQGLPSLLWALNHGANLKDPRAVHYIAGLEHLLNESTKLTVEAYVKDYRDFPMDPTQPGMFLIDETQYWFGFYTPHDTMVSGGNASSRGVELMVQKKLARGLYGLASGAYFRTRYEGLDEIWRDRVWDNRIVLSAEGGWKPNSRWELSTRWIYAGGPPYTPFDMAASQELNRAVLDEARINDARYPAYHALNLRIDRRWHFRASNIVAYLSIWNSYNRRNVASYFWNQHENRPGTIYQWGALPVLGIEYEF